MAVNTLSPEEREQLSTIPVEISDAELVRFFTLQPEDLALIDLFAQPALAWTQRHISASYVGWVGRLSGWIDCLR